MAEYRLHCKVGKVGMAKAHAEYILRENKYSKKEDLIHKGLASFFSRKKIICPFILDKSRKWYFY